MAVDYDLVIIGATLEAREAAAIAAGQGARVALVTPALEPARLAMDYGLQVLTQGGCPGEGGLLAQGGQGARLAPAETLAQGGDDPARRWAIARQWATMAMAIAHPHWSLEALAAQGVDGVIGVGQFSPKPHLAFTTAYRQFTARAYLLATGSQTVIPAIPGLATVPHHTPETLLSLEVVPSRLVVLGRTPAAVSLAQGFAHLGSQVTLISRGDRLLPEEDRDVADFLTQVLVASGVTLRLQTVLEGIQVQGEGLCWQERGGDRLEAEGLLVATGTQPALEGLNLERVGVQPVAFRLPVDRHLRTANRRIYGAGSVLGGEVHRAIARQEVRVAVHNALYWPTRTVNRGSLPSGVVMMPELGRVGLTEDLARRSYGPAVRVVTLPFSASVKAHFREETSGFIKLIGRSDGALLGACLVGPQAMELAQTVGLVLAQGGSLATLAEAATLPDTLTDLLHQAAHTWQQHRWQPGCWRRDWAENWFNWRRSRDR